MPGRRSKRRREAPVIAGRYRLDRPVGRGGMGDVFRATDESTGKSLALKRYRATQGSSDNIVRFRREFHTLASLRHPRIVEVYDYGVHEGAPFYTMELIHGEDLKNLAPAPLRAACLLLRDVASALALVHSRRLLHRDIASRNVRCTASGRAKLLDFGVVGTVGSFGEIVGTVPYLAPEMLLGASLDYRADLFSLGVLAYWLLTGAHAFQASTFEALLDAHRERPAPPSTVAPELPGPLDDLVMSLLDIEPLGRPSSAAEVVDRLGAVADLEPEEEREAARGFVLSAPLVGLEQEMTVARGELAGATRGRGCSILVEGNAGAGGTRLLREIGIEAQLAGARVLRVGARAEVGDRPYAVVHELAVQLLDASFDDAKEAAMPLPVLASALPALAERMGLESAPPPDPRADPRERRLEILSALSSWLLEVSRRLQLAILVDDVHVCDEGSAAVLAALADAAPSSGLFLALTARLGDEARAPEAIAKVRERARVVRLLPLSERGVAQLVRGMFGEVPAMPRLARWMHDVAGGNPSRCADLAHHLVEQGLVRYVGGTWVVAEDLDDRNVPLHLDAAIHASVKSLSGAARRLACILSVRGGEVTLERCVRLLGVDDEAVFDAVDELVRDQIVIGSAAGYRIRNDRLRRALLGSLDEVERRQVELSVGEVLAAGPVEVGAEVAIAWHLLRGGASHRAADLLEAAGRRLFNAASFKESVAPLEAALEVYDADESGRDHLGRRVELEYMLLVAGFFADRSLALRYADRALDLLARASGLGLAVRLRRVLGQHLGLLVGVGVAFLVHVLTSRARRGPSPREAIPMFVRGVVYACGVAAFSFDLDSMQRFVRRVEPLSVVNRTDTRGVSVLLRAMLSFQLGDLRALQEARAEGLALLASDRLLGESERKMAEGAVRFAWAVLQVREGDPAGVDEIEALEALDTRIWSVSALQLRALFHWVRGEEDDAGRVWAQAELGFVQLGSVWQVSATRYILTGMAHAALGDALGVRRAAEGLKPFVDAGYRFGYFVDLLRGEYQRMRGQLDASLESIARALDAVRRGREISQGWAHAAMAETQLALGEHDAAVAAAEEGLRFVNAPERAGLLSMIRFRCGRTAALAESARGDGGAATRRLDELIEQAAGLGNPAFSGLLHEARAAVALDEGDRESFERHSASVDELFRTTRNSVLVARAERLTRKGAKVATAPRPSLDDNSSPTIAMTSAETLAARLTRCRSPAERGACILDVIVESTEALSGFLFLVGGHELQLLAPQQGVSPSERVLSVLADRVAAVEEGGGAQEVVRWGPAENNGASVWWPLVLSVSLGDRVEPVLAAAVFEGDQPPEPLGKALAAAMAATFHEGDSSAVATRPDLSDA